MHLRLPVEIVETVCPPSLPGTTLQADSSEHLGNGFIELRVWPRVLGHHTGLLHRQSKVCEVGRPVPSSFHRETGLSFLLRGVH